MHTLLPSASSKTTMKGEVAAVIAEMQQACRRPLFLAIKSNDKKRKNTDGKEALTPTASYAESETGSSHSFPRAAAGNKRPREDADKPRSWDVVS